MGVPEPFGPPDAGVLHVTSVWEPAGAAPYVLRIGPESPRSARDAQLLGEARAWAEAIVTTGRILREEPTLQHWPVQGGAGSPPRLLVLTHAGVDPAHPALHGGLPFELYDGGVRAGLAHLLRKHGVRRILVEAGPTTALSLYDEPLAVDALWLSRFEEPSLAEGLRGVRFLGPEELAARFSRRSAPVHAVEESGRWSFQRYARGAPLRASTRGSEERSGDPGLAGRG